ncbi:MAG: magnesium/cobalt transporter CorA [Clostridiaceae bacterium]
MKTKKKRIGDKPGTLVYTGNRTEVTSSITLIKYNSTNYKKIENCKLNQVFNLDTNEIKWVNIDGLTNVDIIESIGKKFSLNPLILEDILSTNQRPKVDEYKNSLYIVAKMLYLDKNTYEIKKEQVSFVLCNDYIFTFQEYKGDVFDNVRNQIKADKGEIRDLKSDYLLYALLDSIVDSYFDVLEEIEDKIDEIEDSLMDNPSNDTLQNIYKLKRAMLLLRNTIWPTRTMVSTLIKFKIPQIKDETNLFLRDLQDHTYQLIDTLDIYRESLSGMLDTYLSSISNKTNDIMKFLTIFSTIFIPLTFITGIYGMNFSHMPGINYKHAMPIFYLISIILTFSMLLYFRKKKWL